MYWRFYCIFHAAKLFAPLILSPIILYIVNVKRLFLEIINVKSGNSATFLRY